MKRKKKTTTNSPNKTSIDHSWRISSIGWHEFPSIITEKIAPKLAHFPLWKALLEPLCGIAACGTSTTAKCVCGARLFFISRIQSESRGFLFYSIRPLRIRSGVTHFGHLLRFTLRTTSASPIITMKIALHTHTKFSPEDVSACRFLRSTIRDTYIDAFLSSPLEARAFQ